MIRFLRYFGAESMGDSSKFDLFLDCFGESADSPSQ